MIGSSVSHQKQHVFVSIQTHPSPVSICAMARDTHGYPEKSGYIRIINYPST